MSSDYDSGVSVEELMHSLSMDNGKPETRRENLRRILRYVNYGMIKQVSPSQDNGITLNTKVGSDAVERLIQASWDIWQTMDNLGIKDGPLIRDVQLGLVRTLRTRDEEKGGVRILYNPADLGSYITKH